MNLPFKNCRKIMLSPILRFVPLTPVSYNRQVFINS